MNRLVEIVGMILCVLGIMAIAGSAGDCDGACMDQANTLREMWIIVAAGSAVVAIGAVMIGLARGRGSG